MELLFDVPNFLIRTGMVVHSQLWRERSRGLCVSNSNCCSVLVSSPLPHGPKQLGLFMFSFFLFNGHHLSSLEDLTIWCLAVGKFRAPKISCNKILASNTQTKWEEKNDQSGEVTKLYEILQRYYIPGSGAAVSIPLYKFNPRFQSVCPPWPCCLQVGLKVSYMEGMDGFVWFGPSLA